MGHGEILDHMFYDGLQSPWDGQLMGCFAENTSQKYGFTREQQDAFASDSVRRSLAAIESGAFADEIVPVTVKGRKGETVVDRDETPFTCDLAKIPQLKPAFRKDGTVTAASSSSISDGAAALVLASGAAGAPPVAGDGAAFEAFQGALGDAAARLAEMLVRDGEGVTKVARVVVEGARTTADADRIVRTIAESPLVKTALHGGDPNWGRVLACVGRAGVPLAIDRVSVWIGDVHVAEGGGARDYDERVAAAAMQEDPVRLRVRLGEGGASSWMWTSDFSKDYVAINAHYRT
jgi:hypothetical protein